MTEDDRGKQFLTFKTSSRIVPEFVPNRSKNSTTMKLPRGITIFEHAGRPSPWCVQWRIAGKPHRKWVASRAVAQALAEAKARELSSVGVAAHRLDDDELRAWRTFREQVGDAALDAVARCWRTHGTVAKVPLATAVADFLAAKTAEGVSPHSLAHWKPVFKRFTAGIGADTAGAISREMIAGWVSGLPLAAQSRVSHLTRVRQLFRWLILTRKLSVNPCDGIKAPKVIADDVEVLTVADGAKLFAKASAESRELFGRLALEAFAGLRFASAQVITGADIDFAARGIVLPAAKIKTRRRQFIDGLPDNLWAWLEWSQPSAWVMTPRQYLEAKSLAFVRADVPHPRNCLRHSFTSYHVAANKDAARTSVVLCHTSPAMLWRHYKGRATEADGLAWFRLVPAGSPPRPAPPVADKRGDAPEEHAGTGQQ